ncbi:MAG: hypothetical protein KC776_25400 [Myxococcales bacterium]|nr:hypothetical protein [Myxococcales bacterium]MCB9581783.1 hypothetical protein [Polyangiaceae bacterium]
MEHERVRLHLEGAVRAVTSASTPTLDDATRARRQRLLVHLRDYIDAGRYPINDVLDEPTPIFVDARGARCAVAALLEATGEHELVQHVARTQNLARVRELCVLGEWLAHHGLTVDEAARIQPAYQAHLEPDWRPTVAAIAGAQVGRTEDIGWETVVAAGVRAGLRRNVHGNDDRGNSQYGSWALMGEYAREAVIERGAAHRLSVVLQWEPIGNMDDAQWYLLGGPVWSLDGDDEPGSGFGAQLGVGFSFRRRALPLLIELNGVSERQAGFVTARAGLQLGAVW